MDSDFLWDIIEAIDDENVRELLHRAYDIGVKEGYITGFEAGKNLLYQVGHHE